VDGTSSVVARDQGMSATGSRATANQTIEIPVKIDENAIAISLCKFLTFNFRWGGVLQNFPSNK